MIHVTYVPCDTGLLVYVTFKIDDVIICKMHLLESVAVHRNIENIHVLKS